MMLSFLYTYFRNVTKRYALFSYIPFFEISFVRLFWFFRKTQIFEQIPTRIFLFFQPYILNISLFLSLSGRRLEAAANTLYFPPTM